MISFWISSTKKLHKSESVPWTNCGKFIVMNNLINPRNHWWRVSVSIEHFTNRCKVCFKND